MEEYEAKSKREEKEWEEAEKRRAVEEEQRKAEEEAEDAADTEALAEAQRKVDELKKKMEKGKAKSTA